MLSIPLSPGYTTSLIDLLSCRSRKVIFFDQHIFFHLFSQLVSTFSLFFLPRQKKIFFFTTFPPTANNAILLTTRVPVLHISTFLNLQISRFEQLIATTKSCCSAIHHYLFAVAPTDCSFCHRLLNVYSELTTNLTTAYALTTETTSCFFDHSPTSKHSSTTASTVRVATISTTANDHSFFNQLTQ